MDTKGARTKHLILEKAFVLFSTSAYAKVSLKRIEKETGLSRGALLFHFPTKEQMYKEIVDLYVLQNLSASGHVADTDLSLKIFIDKYVQQLKELKETLFKLGILNMSFALVNLNLQAFHFYPGFEEKAIAWNKRETDIWHTVIRKAIASGEISAGNNEKVLASMFKNLFHGTGYEGINTTTDINLKLLKQQYELLYYSLKRD